MAKKKISIQEPNLIWKIRRKSDGLFSNGKASRPSFKKEGKIFLTHNRLMAHLNYIRKDILQYKKIGIEKSEPYLNCEIVQYKLIEEVAVDAGGYGE